MIENRSIPRCTVIPQLAYPDVGQAVTWLCDVFGFNLRILIGNHRAQLNVGDGAVVVTEQPKSEKADRAIAEAPRFSETASVWHSVMVRVPDVNRHCEHALERGARIVRPPTDYPYGERQYTVEDFTGRPWTFSQSIADVNPEDWGGTVGKL